VSKSKFRQDVFDKSQGNCWYCGVILAKGWHVDHFYPVVRVGDAMLYPELDTIDNMVPSCPQCNMMKSSMPIESFRSTITEFVTSLNKYKTQYKFAKKYGLVLEVDKPVTFFFEVRGLKVKPEHEICKISEDALLMEWKEDKEERDYFYITFNSFICTLKRMGDHWLAIAMGFDWEEIGRIKISGGRLTKAKAAEWAIKLDKPT
jgi:hypothetical protein